MIWRRGQRGKGRKTRKAGEGGGGNRVLSVQVGTRGGEGEGGLFDDGYGQASMKTLAKREVIEKKTGN